MCVCASLSPLAEARGRSLCFSRANTHIPVTTHILVTAHTRFTSFEVRGSVTFVSVCAESPPGPSRAIAGDSARPPGRAQPAGKAQPGAVSDDVTLLGGTSSSSFLKPNSLTLVATHLACPNTGRE
jgi:hypothetical protein